MQFSNCHDLFHLEDYGWSESFLKILAYSSHTTFDTCSWYFLRNMIVSEDQWYLLCTMSKIFSRYFQFQFLLDGIHYLIILLLRNVEVLAPLKWFYRVILGWSMGACSSKMYMTKANKSTHLCSDWWSWWGIHCGTWDPESSSNLWSFPSISWSSCRPAKALGCPISS